MFFNEFYFQPLGHLPLFLEDLVILGTFLGDIDGATGVLQLIDLILVHFDPLIGVGQFLGEYFVVVFVVEDAFPLFGPGLIIHLLEFLLDGSLNFNQLGFQFAVLLLQFSDELILVVGVGA